MEKVTLLSAICNGAIDETKVLLALVDGTELEDKDRWALELCNICTERKLKLGELCIVLMDTNWEQATDKPMNGLCVVENEDYLQVRRDGVELFTAAYSGRGKWGVI